MTTTNRQATDVHGTQEDRPKVRQSPRTARVPASAPATTPCAGKWELFDSTYIEDHRAARALCETCPTIVACMKHLGEVKQMTHSGGGPVGTWAGQLLGRPEVRRFEMSAHQTRLAHRAYARGERTEWVISGERQYQRDRKRVLRGEVA